MSGIGALFACVAFTSLLGSGHAHLCAIDLDFDVYRFDRRHRMKIRRALSEDVALINTIYNWAVLNTTATFDVGPKSLESQHDWFKAHERDPLHPVFVVSDEEAVRGYACLSAWSDRCAYREAAEVSVYIEPKFHGQGLGTLLLKHLDQVAPTLGLHTLLSRVASESVASLKLHERLGFARAGVLREVGFKFQRRLDVVIFQKVY